MDYDSTTLTDKLASVRKHYEILSKIGEGSFGCVFKAKHLETQKLVAIKWIPNVFDNTYQFKKVMREI